MSPNHLILLNSQKLKTQIEFKNCNRRHITHMWCDCQIKSNTSGFQAHQENPAVWILSESLNSVIPSRHGHASNQLNTVDTWLQNNNNNNNNYNLTLSPHKQKTAVYTYLLQGVVNEIQEWCELAEDNSLCRTISFNHESDFFFLETHYSVRIKEKIWKSWEW
jgi:hypothetical protein